MILKFNKEENDKWYVDLPTYDGEHEDLEMVFGADVLLDILSEGNDSVTIDVSTEPKGYGECICGILTEHDDDGGTYLIDYYSDNGKENNIIFGNTIWLCNVTHFVFGEHPKQIYFNLIK